MYYWFKRLIIGCKHDYKEIRYIKSHGLWSTKAILISKCLKCDKIKKDILAKSY